MLSLTAVVFGAREKTRIHSDRNPGNGYVICCLTWNTSVWWRTIMAIRVSLHHKTRYQYEKSIVVYPQVFRLKPAVHSRTPILSYSFELKPGEHFLNWQQDPFGNHLARAVFREKTDHLELNVHLVAELHSINPFDFFLEPGADEYPFTYDADLKAQ